MRKPINIYKWIFLVIAFISSGLVYCSGRLVISAIQSSISDNPQTEVQGFDDRMFMKCGTPVIDTAWYYLEDTHPEQQLFVWESSTVNYDSKTGCPVGIMNYDIYVPFDPIINHSEITAIPEKQ